MRQLVRAAEAKRRHDWNPAAKMMAVMASIHCSEGQNFSMKDFHPYWDDDSDD